MEWFPARTLAESNRLRSVEFSQASEELSYAVFELNDPPIYPYRDKSLTRNWWDNNAWLDSATDYKRCLYMPIPSERVYPKIELLQEFLGKRDRFTLFNVTLVMGAKHPTSKLLEEQRTTFELDDDSHFTLETRFSAMMFYFDSSDSAMLAKLTAGEILRSVDSEKYRRVFGEA